MSKRRKLTPEQKQADRLWRALNASKGPQEHVCVGQPCRALGTSECPKWKTQQQWELPL